MVKRDDVIICNTKHSTKCQSKMQLMYEKSILKHKPQLLVLYYLVVIKILDCTTEN